jgi:AcrR family transcriptional regulator
VDPELESGIGQPDDDGFEPDGYLTDPIDVFSNAREAPIRRRMRTGGRSSVAGQARATELWGPPDRKARREPRHRPPCRHGQLQGALFTKIQGATCTITRVAKTTIRDRKVKETRARIARTALELFISQGYAETTLDQIAEAAEVGRRTIFDHFPTKEAILFDHLLVRHEVAIRHLQDRPASEPAIVGLHAVMRELCEHGYDRELLALIRTVLTMEPQFAYAQLSIGARAFEKDLLSTLEHRQGHPQSSLEAWAAVLMAQTWLDTAIRVYLFEGSNTLVEYFDEVVATCIRLMAEDLRLG